MPAKSEAQQRIMGMALAAKRGKGHFGKKVHEIANSMSEKQLRDFAATKHDELPEKKSELVEALKHKLANLDMNTIGELTFGANYIPRSENGESMLDAAIQRDRNIAKRQAGFNAALNHPVATVTGLGGNVPRAAEDIQEGLNNPNIANYFAPSGDPNSVVDALVHNLHKTSSEKLKGGKGDNKPDSMFSKKELKKGVGHESEHTKDKRVAKEIAKDHLSENKRYYTLLQQAHIE
jgi:hypothetical protein